VHVHNLTFRILAALRDAPADGQVILERLRGTREEGRDPSLPTLYRCLRAGLEETWIEVAETRGDATPGRPPQTYRLTAAGVEALEAEARRHRDLAALVLGAGTPGKPGGN
jgi:DNA-binding PadR family transcriptional regulator